VNTLTDIFPSAVIYTVVIVVEFPSFSMLCRLQKIIASTTTLHYPLRTITLILSSHSLAASRPIRSRKVLQLGMSASISGIEDQGTSGGGNSWFVGDVVGMKGGYLESDCTRRDLG
jgi:hypothetical protein